MFPNDDCPRRMPIEHQRLTMLNPRRPDKVADLIGNICNGKESVRIKFDLFGSYHGII
jgi:hypothetical protein